MAQLPENGSGDFSGVINFLDELIDHYDRRSGGQGSQLPRVTGSDPDESIGHQPRRPLWGDHRSSESAPEDVPPWALLQQQRIDQEPESHKRSRRSIRERVKNPQLIVRLTLVGCLAVGGAVVAQEAIPETATDKIAAVVPLVESPGSNGLHITPQLNCAEEVSGLSIGVMGPLEMGYDMITDPDQQVKAAQDSKFKPTKTISALDPNAPPEVSDASLQKMDYPTAPTVEDLAAGKVTTQNTGTQNRLRMAYFSGPNVKILACPTDSDPAAYIHRIKDNKYEVDASKLALVVLAGKGTGNGWQAGYESNLINPAGKADRKSITDAEINRINEVLLPDPDKPALNPKVVNHIIQKAMEQLTSPQCQKPLLDSVANGIAAKLRTLSGHKNYYSVNGPFISPKDSWDSAHKPEDYSPDAKIVDSEIETFCTNFKSID